MYKEINLLNMFLPEGSGREGMEGGMLVIGSLNMDMVINVKNMPLVGKTILGEG